MAISSLSRSLRIKMLPLLVSGLGLLAGTSPAMKIDTDAGLRLLQAQLPAGTTAALTDCEHLSSAVVRATYADRSHAPDILAAALSAGLDQSDPGHRVGRRPCACVVRIFRNVLIVAPDMASALLETASAVYPECSDALTEAVDTVSDKNPVDGKDRAPSALQRTPPSTNTGVGNDPGTGAADPGLDGDLGSRDLAGLGFSPGFPGTPGFVGSSASGGTALPPPAAPAVTSVVNQ